MPSARRSLDSGMPISLSPCSSILGTCSRRSVLTVDWCGIIVVYESSRSSHSPIWGRQGLSTVHFLLQGQRTSIRVSVDHKLVASHERRSVGSSLPQPCRRGPARRSELQRPRPTPARPVRSSFYRRQDARVKESHHVHQHALQKHRMTCRHLQALAGCLVRISPPPQLSPARSRHPRRLLRPFHSSASPRIRPSVGVARRLHWLSDGSLQPCMPFPSYVPICRHASIASGDRSTVSDDMHWRRDALRAHRLHVRCDAYPTGGVSPRR